MPGLVPGIYVFHTGSIEDVDGRARQAEAAPFLERLCPAMTRYKPEPEREHIQSDCDQ
jgi:hypothetical protein